MSDVKQDNLLNPLEFAPTLFLKGNCGSSADFVGFFAAVTVYMWANIQQAWSLYTDHFNVWVSTCTVRAYFAMKMGLVDIARLILQLMTKHISYITLLY